MCRQHKGQSEFDKRVWSNASSDNRHLVCISCQHRGFSPRDTAVYRCSRGCDYGHLSFPRVALKDFKRGKGALLCTLCTEAAMLQEKQDNARARERREAAALQEKQDAARARDIKRALATRGSWACSCHRNIGHAEKCPLFSCMAGERRWPGKNKGVTQEDLAFLAKRQRR